MVGPVLRALIRHLASTSPDSANSQRESVISTSSGPPSPTSFGQGSSPETLLLTPQAAQALPSELQAQQRAETATSAVGESGFVEGGERSDVLVVAGRDLDLQPFPSCVCDNFSHLSGDDSGSSDLADKNDIESLDDGFLLPPPQYGLGDNSGAASIDSDLDDDLVLSVRPVCCTCRGVSRFALSMTIDDPRSVETPLPPPRSSGVIAVLGDQMFVAKVLPYVALVDAGAVLCCGRYVSRRALELFWKQVLQDRLGADSALVHVALCLLTASRAHAPSLGSLACVVMEGLHELQHSSEEAVAIASGSTCTMSAGPGLDDGFALPPPALEPTLPLPASPADSEHPPRLEPTPIHAAIEPQAASSRRVRGLGTRLPQPAAWAAGQRRRAARRGVRRRPPCAAQPCSSVRPMLAALLEAAFGSEGGIASGLSPHRLPSRASGKKASGPAPQRAGGKWWKAECLSSAAGRRPPRVRS